MHGACETFHFSGKDRYDQSVLTVEEQARTQFVAVRDYYDDQRWAQAAVQMRSWHVFRRLVVLV